MSRQFLTRLSLLATPVVALALYSCAPSEEGGPGTAGTSGQGTAGTTGAAGTGSAGTGSAGTGSAGTGSTQGTAGTGAGTAGTGAGTAGTTGTAGTGAGTAGTGAAVACGTIPAQVNHAVLSLTKTDISAYKYANTPTNNIMKIEYDPSTKMVYTVTRGGVFHKFDPNIATLPAVGGANVTTAVVDTNGFPGTGDDTRGLAFDSAGTMYVLSSRNQGGNSVIVRKGVAAAGGGARTWTTIATSAGYPLPIKGANFGHSFSGLAISSDGQSLYFSSGSRTDHGEDEEGQREIPLTSAVFKVPTSGSNIALPNDANMLTAMGYLFADGTRNTFDLAFNAAGDLIGTENGPDADFPDELNWLQSGKHYGFPWRFGADDNPDRMPGYAAAGDMRLHTGYQAVDKNTYGYDAAFPAPPTGVTFVDPIMNAGPDADSFRTGKTGTPQDASTLGMSMPGISGHRSPLGISFDTTGKLCGDYNKQGFFLSYGSLPQGGFADKGEDLTFIQLTKGATAYTMKATVIAKGIKVPMDSVLVGNRLFTVSINTSAPIYMFLLPAAAP